MCIRDSLEVALVFDRYSAELRPKLLHLRDLILDTAANTDGVGQLKETLKWGQPSYLTHRPKSGTTIRIDHDPSVDGKYGMYVHCQSKVVEAAQMAYPTELTFEGTRAIVFHSDEPVPEHAVRHFITLALTYHRWK